MKARINYYATYFFIFLHENAHCTTLPSTWKFLIMNQVKQCHISPNIIKPLGKAMFASQNYFSIKTF